MLHGGEGRDDEGGYVWEGEAYLSGYGTGMTETIL